MESGGSGRPGRAERLWGRGPPTSGDDIGFGAGVLDGVNNRFGRPLDLGEHPRDYRFLEVADNSRTSTRGPSSMRRVFPTAASRIAAAMDAGSRPTSASWALRES